MRAIVSARLLLRLIPVEGLQWNPFQRPRVFSQLVRTGCEPMLKWILILLAVAAIAGLLGLNSVSGAALLGAKVLIGIALVVFILMVLGIVVIA